MANTSPIFVANITGKGTSWTNSDAALTKKTISPTIGSNGARIHTLIATTTDTTSRDWCLYLNDGTSDFLVGALSVLAGSGQTSTTAAIAIASLATNFPWLSSDGSLMIPAGWILKGENQTQVTSAKTTTFTVIGGDY